MEKNNKKNRIKLNNISHYMRKRKIPKGIQMKARRYIEYMHEEENYGNKLLLLLYLLK